MALGDDTSTQWTGCEATLSFKSAPNERTPLLTGGGTDSECGTLVGTSPLSEPPPICVTPRNWPNLLLANTGSVARDHLASERTYLAYIRTSLGLASAGVALMQLLQMGGSGAQYGTYLGVLCILGGIVVLYIGTRRFFLVQKTLLTGQYLASFGEIICMSFLLGVIITVLFAVLISGVQNGDGGRNRRR